MRLKNSKEPSLLSPFEAPQEIFSINRYAEELVIER